MPGADLFATELTPSHDVGFFDGLPFGFEVVLGERTKAFGYGLRSFFVPAFDQIFDVFGKGAVEVVRRVILASVGDAGV